MKNLEIISRKVICSNPDSRFSYFAWPTVGRLPGGDLAVVASGFRTRHVDPFGKGVISYSKNEGESWTTPGILIDTPLDDRDMGIVTFGKQKERVLVTSFNNRVEMQREWLKNQYAEDKDGNNALIEAYLDTVTEVDMEKYHGAVYKISDDGGYNFGELKKAPVMSPHGPCCLSDGSLIFIGVYVDVPASKNGIYVYRMDADSSEFYPCGEIDISVIPKEKYWYPCEVFAVETEPGKLVVHIRVHVHHTNYIHLWQCESSDGGNTFTKPHKIMGDNDGAPSHILNIGGILLCTYGYRQMPYGIRAMFSIDGGNTWDMGYAVDDTLKSDDCGYPSSVLLKDGNILTAYYGTEKNGTSTVIMQTIWKLPEEYKNFG